MRRRGFLNQEAKDPEFVHYCTIAAGYLNEQKSWLSMKPLKTWRSLFRKRNSFCDGGIYGCKMKQMPFFCILCIVTLFIVYRTTTYQYQDTTIEERLRSFEAVKEVDVSSQNLNGLPQGIIQAKSDLELRPLWSTSSSRSKVNDYRNHSLLAISVGIKQKRNVDSIVRKFLSGNFSIILFHYDGKVDEWWDLKWSSKAIHIVGQNQTKWWFAKRFLHPAVVSVYDFIFLWDEDLGVEHFSPKRYLDIVKSEGLEISQPALDPNSTDIHHRITVRARTKKIHRRVYDKRGTLKCTDNSDGPPCTGFVEGMAPVFSRAAWNCAWHLIQNDLIHGWGMDMKLGYCAQGDRTEKVGIVDSEYIVHKGIQTLGGGASSDKNKRFKSTSDVRTEIRRQSTWELRMFKERWNKAIAEDKYWVDPFKRETDRDGRRHVL